MKGSSHCMHMAIASVRSEHAVSARMSSYLKMLELLGAGMHPIETELSQEDKSSAASLVIHYIAAAVTDHHICAEEMQNIDALKSIFAIREGELLQLQEMEIEQLLGTEARRILADAHVDDREAAHQSDLQRALDLGYDEHLRLIRSSLRPIIDDILDRSRGLGEQERKDAIRKVQALQTVVRIDPDKMIAVWPED